jgi:hypothetical protein
MKTPGSPEGAAPARTRIVLRRLSLFIVALAFAAFAASALAGSFATTLNYQFSGSISSSDPVVTNPPFKTERRACSNLPATSNASGNFHYKLYRFQNLRGWFDGGVAASHDVCVNVTLLVHSGSASASGYAGQFNPGSPNGFFYGSVGGLGPGQSGDFELYIAGLPQTPQPYAFDVIVYETVAAGDNATYTLLVEGTGIIMVGGGPTATASLQSFRASSSPKGVDVRWKTQSENQTLGFNVYRGDVKKVRLTRSMVRASGNGRGHTYSYIDRSARKSKAAPYYLEVVQRGGSKIMFGPAAH